MPGTGERERPRFQNRSTGSPDKGFLAKYLCRSCRRVFKRPATGYAFRACPHCHQGQTCIRVSHRFRPPRLSNQRAWKVVDLLITNGFYFDKLFVPVDGIEGEFVQARYPKTLIEAREFLRRYGRFGSPLPAKNDYSVKNSR